MSLFHNTCLLTKVVHSAEETLETEAFLNEMATDEKRQASFFEYCKQWKLAPWVFTQLDRNSWLEKLTPQVQDQFREMHARILGENERRNREALKFLQRFTEEGIEVIILKGNVFAHEIYRDPGYKKMNDFDILIRRERWEQVQDIYTSLGYIPLGFGWSGEKEKPARFSHVGMSFISPDFSCIIGTQWGLKSPTTSFQVDIEEAWATAVDFEFQGLRVKQLSPEYNLLHLILHMGIYKCGIRDCMDVYNLMATTAIKEEQCVDLLRRSKAVDKTCFTLALSGLCAGNPAWKALKLKPSENSFISRRLQKRLAVHERSGDFQDSYNDYFQDIEKLVIYFNLYPAFHIRSVLYFKILGHIFFPKNRVALKLSDEPENSRIGKRIIAQLRAPYFVFSLISLEIGQLFTFLLFVKLGFDWILSLKNYFIKKESYFDYLRKRGIDPHLIGKVVKNIQ